jgi:hypothetical protein
MGEGEWHRIVELVTAIVTVGATAGAAVNEVSVRGT